MIFKYNDIAKCIGGFNKGRKGKIYSNFLGIWYCILEEHEEYNRSFDASSR